MHYKKIKKVLAVLAIGSMLTFTAAGCSLSNNSNSTTTSSETVEAVDINNLFSDRDLDSSYDASSPKITLSDSSITSDSDNAKVSGNTVTISAGGTYIITGSASDAQIIIDAGTDKVQLVLDNASLTSSSAAAIYVKQADKVFVTLADGTTNTISISSDSVEMDDSTVDGAIYSKDDLTFNGNGTLNVTSTKTNGIVGKDDLKLVSGTINVTSGNHAIQGKDTISVKEAVITANAGKDGLHSDGTVSIVGGNINITNSVEGIEGQVINMAGGTTNVVSSDDALNAATADSNTSNNPEASDSNAVLNISGGKLTVNSNGDGLDSNGAINISGGETYVSGPTNDGNTAIDFGSECVVTGGILVAAGSSGMVEAMSDKSTQAVMTVNASSNSGTITVTDSSNNTVVEYTPDKQYACVTISAPTLQVGQTYKVTCGTTSEDITLNSTVTSNVQATMGGGMGGGQMGNMQGSNKGGNMQGGNMQPPSGQTDMMQPPSDQNGQMQNGQMQPPSDQNGQMQNKMNRGNMQNKKTN